MFKTLYVVHGNPGRLLGAKSILVIFGEISWGFRRGWECLLPAYLKSQNTRSPCFRMGWILTPRIPVMAAAIIEHLLCAEFHSKHFTYVTHVPSQQPCSVGTQHLLGLF